jgi:hypothetical protein
MKMSTKTRLLTQPEQLLAQQVFQNTLPAWKVIGIRDGLGIGDAPWTDQGLLIAPKLGYIGYQVMMGSWFDSDLTSTSLTAYGRICDIFVHEMTHVWQYNRGDWVKTSAIGARIWESVSSSITWDSKGPRVTGGDDAYESTLGKPWKDYNVEEQATIVERWYRDGASASDARFPYIEKVIRKGGGWGMFLPLDKLKAWDGKTVPPELKFLASMLS